MRLHEVTSTLKKKSSPGFQKNQNSSRANFKKIRKKIYYNNCEDLEKNLDKIKHLNKTEIRITIITNILRKHDCHRNVLNILALKILIKVTMFNHHSLDVSTCRL